MISRIDFFTKPEGMTDEAFSAQLTKNAAEIAPKLKNLRKYQVNTVVSKVQNADLGRGLVDMDGFTEMYFDSIYDMNEALNALTEEERGAVCSTWGVINVRKEDTPVPPLYKDVPLIKRISFIAHKDTVDIMEFKKQWWGKHSDIMKRAPGYLSYTQNLVIDRYMDGKPCGYGVLPIIGMVELFFTDQIAWDTFYDGDSMLDLRAHHGTFIGTLTNFNVETVTVAE